MIKVLYNNKEYDVPENEVDKFVSISPGAQIMKNGDPGKQTPAVQGATVEETAAPDMDSTSDPGSLVPQEDKINYGESYKSYEENRNSKTRIDFLLNSKVDPYAPALTSKIARSKIKSSILDDDFQPGREINIDQEKYSSIIQKAINSDSYLNDLSSDILKFNKAFTDKILNDVKKEFDLTTEEGVKNANEEYVKRINAFLSNKISSNKTFEDRINKFQNALDAELEERNVKYNRERLGLDEKTYFGEFLKSGFKDITLAIKKGATANIGENIIRLKKERESIENSRDNAEVSYGGTFSQKEGFKIGTKKGSKEEALGYYDQEITDAKSKFLANLKGIEQREIDLSFYKQLPKDVDYFSKDGLGLIAKQIPQLGFAAFTGGLGVYMQEFGSAYFENVYNSLGDKPATAENILKAVEAGNGERGLATTQAVISSLLESYGASQIVKGVLGSAGGKDIVRSIVKDGLKKYIKSGGLKEGGKGILKGGFTEYLTEGFQTIVSQLGAGAAQDDIFKYIDLNNVIKSAQDGGFVGAVLPFAGNVTRATARETVQTVKEISSKFDPKRITPILSNTKKELEIKVKNNEITREEADETIQAINNIEDANLKIPTYIKNESRIEAVDLIVEKQKILNNIKNLDENFLEADTSRLEEINNRLVQINKEGDVKKSTEFAKSAESIGLETLAFQNTQDFKAGIEADGIKLNDEQKSELGEVGGFISGNKIYINEQVAAETSNLNVGGHEVMHGVIAEKLKTLNPEQLQQLQNNFLELLPTTEKQLLQDALNKRYDPSEHAKEFFSVFSDLSQDGSIKYKQDWATKLKDWLTEMIRRFTPYKKIEFNNAQDVFNFSRQYTNSINKGRLSKGLAKGIGKVGLAEVALSKQASDNVQNIYNEKGVDGSFDIIEAFNPIINKLVDKRREAPNFNKEDLTSEIKYSDRGILGLIRSYNPDSGVPLAAYVNKFLPSRMIEASNKILGEEFTVDVTEAKGVTAQETETVTEKPVSKKIKPSSLLKDIEAAKSKIMKGLKNVPKKDLTFKRLKDLSPETTAEIFEVPAKKVTDPKANLNKGDLNNAARNINKNVDKLLRLLPKGAVVEAASERLLGTSTGVPKSLLDVFYTKQERLTRGAGLSPYKLNSINRQQFLEGLGIVDGKLREGLSPRSPEAQRIKGIMNLTGKLITNEIVRSESDLSLEAKQDLAAGKADVMFSKVKKLKINEQVANEFGGKINKDNVQEIGKIFRSYVKMIDQVPNSAFFMTPSNLAPGGNSIRRMRDGIFVSQALDNATIQARDKGELLEVIALQKIKEELGLPLTTKGKKVEEAFPWTMVIKSQKTKNLNKNLNIRENFKSNFKGALDILSDMYAIDPKATGLVVYNQNANGATTRNMAQLIGLEQGAIKILEEHILQHGQFAKLVGVYSKIKDADTKTAMANWLADNYIQIALKSGEGKNRTDSHYKVDLTYDLNGKKYKSKSELHPLLEQKIQEAINGKISWKEVPSSNIRLYNEVVKLNPNAIKQEGITHAEKYNVVVPSKLSFDANVYEKQSDLIFEQIKDEITPVQAKNAIDTYIKERYPDISKATLNANKLAPKKEQLSFSKKKKPSNKEVIENLEKIDKANIEASKARTAEVDINKEFNQYLESATGIGAEKVFNQAKAEARGSKVRKSFGDYFIPPGAEDFGGLMHKTLAKGKKGEKQLEFYKKYLYDPYNAAMESITREKSAMMNDFMALKKQFSNVPKRLKKFTKGGDYTNDQAVRVYAWTRQSMEIPGLSKKDVRELVNEVKNDKELLAFATELINITKGDGYPKPQESWMGGNVAIDLMSLLNGDKRSKHLEAWQNNVDILFSKENMFKLEAAYGKNWVKNVKATLQRMKNGSNKKWGGDKNLQAWNDWVNGSVGTIMFLNTRSAALQMISNVNYINYKDNNPLRAAQAFANQPQYWADFVEIFNSDYLQERRGGNKININESELALAAEKGGVQGTISYLLNKGFILTKMADSFAIASGGATMYRNRIKTYIKDGMSEADAKKQAFLDFKAITEETQQSSRPDRISEQQAGNLGRFMLAFANTPMQYNRIIKRNAQDLIDGRGDPKEKLSKILYYSTIQNLIFNAMQKAVFALAFADDDDDEKIVSKASDIGNGMADSLLRGSGLTGNAIVAAKNVAMEIAKQSKKPNPDFQQAAWKTLTVSPPLYGKLTRLRGAGYSMKYVTPKNVFEPKLDNPALSAAAQTASATFNFPLDRALRKAQNIEAAMSDEAEWWQSTALLMGWGSWELGIENEKDKKEKQVKRRKGRTIVKRKIK
jgi:hypothetical protein